MAGMRRPVAVIIGMMGAGKTRVGKEVAQMMNLPFADADNEIEYDAGMRIPEYFEKYGESEFRKLESDVVLDMLEDFDGIFSLGGGAPMTPSIQEGLARYVASGGKVVYLMADPEEAMERANRGGGRPMLNGDANMRWKKLYKERDPVFRRVANVHVGTRGQSPQAAARKLMEMIDQRIVHVTGSTIEPYDVHIGEGVMGQLAQILGSKPVKVALIHTQPVQRHSGKAKQIEETSIDILTSGRPLTVWPEGTVTRDPKKWVMSIKEGVGYIALESSRRLGHQVPLYPAVTWGAASINHWWPWPRKNVVMCYDHALDYSDLLADMDSWGEEPPAEAVNELMWRVLKRMNTVLEEIRGEQFPAEGYWDYRSMSRKPWPEAGGPFPAEK